MLPMINVKTILNVCPHRVDKAEQFSNYFAIIKKEVTNK